MPDHLKDLFDRALDDEPPPGDDLAQLAMAQGRGIRRRRRLLAGGATASAVVAVAVALNLAPTPAGPPPTVTPAAIRMAQAEPECTWGAWDNQATDLSIFLHEDVTDPQRTALRESLSANPLVRNLRFESRYEAYEKFKEIWRDSPDLVAEVDPSQMPESFRLELTQPKEYPGFAATYAHHSAVQELVGGTCP